MLQRTRPDGARAPRRPRPPAPPTALPRRAGGGEVKADAEADMPSAEASGAMCVQRFDGSRNSAIHTTYRISLRSSSIREPRYPLLRVVFGLVEGGWAAPPSFRGCVCLGWVGVLGRRGGGDLGGGDPSPPRPPAPAGRGPPLSREGALPGPAPASRRLSAGATGWSPGVGSIDSMILPQVHLRKPCYDFSFL